MMDEVRRISEAVEPRLHVPRRRRHDRPGRGQRRPRRSTRPSSSTASSSPSSTATPAAAPRCRSRRSSAGRSPSRRPARSSTDFDLFHPDRLAGRILGMGDMLTLIEKAEEVYEKDEAEEAAAKLLEGEFTLDDFLDQMQQVKKMGPLSEPGRHDARACPRRCANAEIDDKRDRPDRGDHPVDDARGARATPSSSTASRRTRIATGSGHHAGRGRPSSSSSSRRCSKMMKRMGGFGSKRMAKKSARTPRTQGRRAAVGSTPRAAAAAPARPRPGQPGAGPGAGLPSCASWADLPELPSCGRARLELRAVPAHHGWSPRTGARPSTASASRRCRTYEERRSNVVKLRLMRMGKKKQPTYRVVAADARSPRDGRFIEIVGTYEPRQRAVGHHHRQRQGGGLAAQGRPADRDASRSC